MTILHHQYLGNYPKDRHTGWSDGLQGVTHDTSFWYFTRTPWRGHPALWRIPVTYDLNKRIDVNGLPTGVSYVTTEGYLADLGYDHFGDLDYWHGYLFVASDGSDPAIAVYKARSLQFIGRIMMTQSKKQCGWCAIRSIEEGSPIGVLVTSNGDDLDQFQRYQLDLSAINAGRMSARPLPTIHLRDQSNQPLSLRTMQGGTFAPDGSLYVINGYETGSTANCGIHRFRLTADIASNSTLTAIETHHSTNGSGDFNYEYHPGSRRDEPEGITYWNLEDGRAPGIRGHLHAMMINNDYFSPDDLYFKHYRVTHKKPAPPPGHNDADHDDDIHEPTPPPGGQPY